MTNLFLKYPRCSPECTTANPPLLPLSHPEYFPSRIKIHAHRDFDARSQRQTGKISRRQNHPHYGGFVECTDTTAGISRLAERIRPKATARYTHIACQGLQRLDIKSIRYNTLLTDWFMIEQSRSHCKTSALQGSRVL